MIKNAVIFLLMLSPCMIMAQVSFKTIVPQEPVVVNESFQVQYVLEDAEKPGMVEPPVFRNFRLVTGPNTYTGSVTSFGRERQLKNVVYTLVALRRGHFIIPGASTLLNGRRIRSNDVIVEVVSEAEATRRFNKQLVQTSSEYFLRAGEDPYEKIKKNLFMKVVVDRNNCFVGEPVVATFKLYSRLESKSDIVKNPGFYGFTVHDMVSLADHQSTVETIDGKPFDVHTIRKVQLYPLRSGQFSIDAMEVKNKVEFSKSTVNKKTEQEIIEGVLNDFDSQSPRAGTEIFETSISTKPIAINVKGFPDKNRPAVFNGATGNFSISAAVINDHLSRNEEGSLAITITGKGNFTQLEAPVVQWPEFVEGFEPVVVDTLNKDLAPLQGSRIFKYAFVSAKPGTYTLPAIKFSFHDPSSGIYRTLQTQQIPVYVSVKEKSRERLVKESKPEAKSSGQPIYWISAATVLIALLVVFIIWKRSGVKRGKPQEEPVSRPAISIEQLLQPVSIWLHADDKSFYTGLHLAIWKFFGHHFKLSAGEMNKALLERKLKERMIDDQLVTEMLMILQQAEAGRFTGAELKNDKKELLHASRQILAALNDKLL